MSFTAVVAVLRTVEHLRRPLHVIGYTSVVEARFTKPMINTQEIKRQEDVAAVAGSIRSGTTAPYELVTAVRRIVDAVRDGGDRALVELTREFDGVDINPGGMEVPEEERLKTWAALDPVTRSALEAAAARVADFQRRCIPADWSSEAGPGIRVGRVRRPLERVGVYVPGGRFPYPSTVLMTGIPANVAGVEEVVFCIPPGSDGAVHGATLGATTLIERSRVFRVGGAQAVAAMALGTETVPRCPMVAGPGNIYVTVAKRMLAGEVSVDLEAGPSEVAIYADGSADPSYAAADMLAQMEHDPLSIAVVVSESREVIDRCSSAIAGLAEGEASSGLLERGASFFVLSGSRTLSLAFINELAPEHLELMVADPDEVLPRVTSAGCVCVGTYSAAALGDYVSGPSHVLPTGGSAGRLSGLSAGSFSRYMSVIAYDRGGVEVDAEVARRLAGLEGLRWHALSIDMRIGNES